MMVVKNKLYGVDMSYLRLSYRDSEWHVINNRHNDIEVYVGHATFDTTSLLNHFFQSHLKVFWSVTATIFLHLVIV